MDEVVNVWRDQRVGRIQLNRPKALNALDLTMVQMIHAALDDFRDDNTVHAVVIEAAGGRAFCAGGDVRAIRDNGMAGRPEANREFFAAEYAMNQAIADFPKPYVALIDGICLGGGIGASVHGSHRIATEKAGFAMPETAIALFPDVGATYVLPRMPGAVGMYLALTGTRVSGGDAVHAGFATHFVPSARLSELSAAIASDGVAVIAGFAEGLPEFSLGQHRAVIDAAFSADSVAGIFAALEADGGEFAKTTLATLRGVSPSSLHWSFKILRDGVHRNLRECLAAELALVTKITSHPEFLEGVRAVVVDKDRAPKWQPAASEDVDPEAINSLFA
jgi:enoyl-CoA hydratase/carnithine racemase